LFDKRLQMEQFMISFSRALLFLGCMFVSTVVGSFGETASTFWVKLRLDLNKILSCYHKIDVVSDLRYEAYANTANPQITSIAVIHRNALESKENALQKLHDLEYGRMKNEIIMAVQKNRLPFPRLMSEEGSGRLNNMWRAGMKTVESYLSSKGNFNEKVTLYYPRPEFVVNSQGEIAVVHPLNGDQALQQFYSVYAPLLIMFLEKFCQELRCDSLGSLELTELKAIVRRESGGKDESESGKESDETSRLYRLYMNIQELSDDLTGIMKLIELHDRDLVLRNEEEIRDINEAVLNMDDDISNERSFNIGETFS
jgi:hypothetical protein